MLFFLASHLVKILFETRSGRKDAAELIEIICQEWLKQNSSVANGDYQTRSNMQPKLVYCFGWKRDIAAGFERDDLSIHSDMLLLQEVDGIACNHGFGA